MIGYSFEYQGTLGDVGTGRWQRSDQSVSSTTSSEKTIGRTRTVEGGVEQAANKQATEIPGRYGRGLKHVVD